MAQQANVLFFIANKIDLNSLIEQSLTIILLTESNTHHSVHKE